MAQLSVNLAYLSNECMGRVEEAKGKEKTTEEAWTVGRLGKSVKRPATIDAVKAAAIEDLFHRHYASLVKSLSFIVLDREVAADAAQEAFFQLHLKWDRVSGYEDPVAWLYRVAIYKCRDHKRALSRAVKLLERIAGAGASAESEPWSIESDFLRAFRTLPGRQRTAASLHYLSGFSLQQVAEAMNISEGTAKTHLFRARERLRKELEVTQ
jgi:RNA polymerase sigma-70 factor (ECF subfamily)